MIHIKMKIPLFTHVVPNLYDFLSFVEHKRFFEECCNQFWLPLYGQNSVFHTWQMKVIWNDVSASEWQNYPWCAIFAGEQYGCAGLFSRGVCIWISCLLCLFLGKRNKNVLLWRTGTYIFWHSDFSWHRFAQSNLTEVFGLRKAGFMLWWSWMPPKNNLVLI